jgi:hypothetical protein
MKTICLVMIVKNEKSILSRCFDSVYKYIDCWYICDTGSTDGTQKFIKNYFKEKKIPGTLKQDTWDNFGANRSRAVGGAYNKADYLLLMDADFMFCVKDPDFKKKIPSCDSFHIKYEGILDYRQMLFVSGRIKWRYTGVTHEYIHSDIPTKCQNLDFFTFNHKADGGNRSDKYERDVRLLLKGIQDEPNNYRYLFYLAQSYKDLASYDNAIKYYELRAQKGGWGEEVYYSYYQIGMNKLRRGDSFDDYKDDLYKAYEYRPSRLESLFHLISYCRVNKLYDMGYKYGIKAVDTPYPKDDVLFIEKHVHEWGFFDELALCAHFSGRNRIAIDIYKRLMDENRVPDAQKDRFRENMYHFKKAYEKELRDNFEKEIDSNRIAIIIVNQNMPKETEELIDYIKKEVKLDYDIIVVDNNSQENMVSPYTTIKLNNNVNITAAWMVGINYCDILESTNKVPYFSYYFTSCKAKISNNNNNENFLTTSYNIMKNDISVVGYHPSLTLNSDPTFTYMKTDSDKRVESINNIDNIFSCYRASWFNKAGRFSLKLMYTRGIGIELGYIADIERKLILLDNRYQVEYTVKHDNETSRNEIVDYYQEKYGLNYTNLLYRKINQRLLYTKELSKNIIIKNFTVFFIYYGYRFQTGDTCASIRSYAEYFTAVRDKVIVLERLPTQEEFDRYKPDCIISAEGANEDVGNNIVKWNLPWIVLTYAPNQYIQVNQMYPSIVTYTSSELKIIDQTNINKLVVRDPVNHKLYSVRDTNKIDIENTYVTLIGDPAKIKGHFVLFELATRLPNINFMLVTNQQYDKDKLPSNVLIQEYNTDIDIMKEKVYGKTKVLIVPSITESFSRVTIEAIGSKIPCIITKCAGLEETTYGLSNYVPNIQVYDTLKQDVNKWESELVRVLNNYDEEVEKSEKILHKLDYERDLIHVRGVILMEIQKHKTKVE